jgi:hypothetical protein
LGDGEYAAAQAEKKVRAALLVSKQVLSSLLALRVALLFSAPLPVHRTVKRW